MSRNIARPTVKGLLDAAERGDVDQYVAERRTHGVDEEWSVAEKLLQDLHTKELVFWGDTLIDVKLTEKGRELLARYRKADR